MTIIITVIANVFFISFIFLQHPYRDIFNRPLFGPSMIWPVSDDDDDDVYLHRIHSQHKLEKLCSICKIQTSLMMTKIVQYSTLFFSNFCMIYVSCQQIYVTIYIYIYIYIPSYIYIYLCIYVYIYVYIYIYIHILIHIQWAHGLDIRYYVCIYTYMYTCMHVYVYIFLYIYICIYTYIHMYVWGWMAKSELPHTYYNML
jgi:hypothetical protein